MRRLVKLHNTVLPSLTRRGFSAVTNKQTASYSSQAANTIHSSGRAPTKRINLAISRLPFTAQLSHKPFTSRTMATDAAALIEASKKAAAFQAVTDYLLPSYKYIGIGSGSTVVYIVDAIVSMGPAFYSNMVFIPTGSQSKSLIRAAGLRLCSLDERPAVDGKAVPLDVAFDGADEVDEELNLIKGGGACLFQEKLVAAAAKQFVAVAGKSLLPPIEIVHN